MKDKVQVTVEAIMDLRQSEADYLKAYLTLHGYDGLFCQFEECACDLADLMECGMDIEETGECRPGYKRPMTAEEKESGEYTGDWMMGPTKPEVKV